MALRASSGSVISSSSRGGTGWSPRTTTRPAKISSNGAATSGRSAAGPVITPRRNQRGPSTPRKRIGCRPLSGGSPGTRTCSSGPNGPSASSARPPASVTAVAISCRTSSQSPSLLGAAKAWTWSEPSSRTTAISGPWSSAMLSWISNPSTTGTWRLPKSTRLSGGMSSRRVPRPPRWFLRRTAGAAAAASTPAPSQDSSSPGSSQVSSSSDSKSSLTSSSLTSGSAASSRRRRRNTVLLPAMDHGAFWTALDPGRFWTLEYRATLGRRLRAGVPAGGPETAVAPRRPGQGVHLVEHRAGHALDDELRDPVAALELHGLQPRRC